MIDDSCRQGTGMSVELLREKKAAIDEISQAYRHVQLGRGHGPIVDRYNYIGTQVLLLAFFVATVSAVVFSEDVITAMYALVLAYALKSVLAIIWICVIRKAAKSSPTWAATLASRLATYEPTRLDIYEAARLHGDEAGNIPVVELGDWIRAELDEVYGRYEQATIPRVKLPPRSATA